MISIGILERIKKIIQESEKKKVKNILIAENTVEYEKTKYNSKSWEDFHHSSFKEVNSLTKDDKGKFNEKLDEEKGKFVKTKNSKSEESEKRNSSKDKSTDLNSKRKKSKRWNQ